MYGNGLGVARDEAEAARWYKKAAELGDAEAQFKLGNMFYQGDGVPKDNVEARRWYRMAADQGHAESQRALQLLYK
jgi:TPR repeat protein